MTLQQEDIQIMNIKILKFIKRKNSASKEQILKRFPDHKHQTLHRLEQMSKPKGLRFTPQERQKQYLQETYKESRPDEFGNIRIIYTGKYSLTKYGYTYLEDYVLFERRDVIKEFVRSFLFPSLVALLVSVLTNLLFS